LNRISDN